MKFKIVVLALLLSAGVARGDSFFASFTCTEGPCEGLERNVPMHFNQTDSTFHGTAHWDTVAWDFFLPTNWATGLFTWAGFPDISYQDVRFLTFRIDGYSDHSVELNRLCPTAHSCEVGYESGFVVFSDRPLDVPEPTVIENIIYLLVFTLLFLGALFVGELVVWIVDRVRWLKWFSQ